MSTKLFGTDGIRGLVNSYPITPEIVLKFGIAAGIHFKSKESKKKVVIAKDTRLSGYLMEPALTAGLIAVGVDVVLVGPMPTPAVPMLIRSLRADFGIMISASHNPYYDNGLKLFDSNGNKLGDACESSIQDLILNNNLDSHLAQHDKLGRARRLNDAPGRYIEYVKNSFLKRKTLHGIKVVVDCANGSAYKLAPKILWELGAEVVEIGCNPNGLNINELCGSNNPNHLSEKVLETGADIGIALDGDADRVVVCDENGQIIPGDCLIALIAMHLKAQDLLNSGVVVTQMSNSALDKFLNDHDIAVYRSKIGDRYVAAEMKFKDCNLGGEESGHIILGDYSTSGDGILAALQILSILVLSDSKKMSALGSPFILNPQVMNNIRYSGISPLENHKLVEKIERIKEDNANIRIIVRKSGTESLIRTLLEGDDIAKLKLISAKIAELIASK